MVHFPSLAPRPVPPSDPNAAAIGSLEEEHEQRLKALSQPQRAAYTTCRTAAMSRRPGSEKWIFPPVLMPWEEAAFRAEYANAPSSDDSSQSSQSSQSSADSDTDPEVNAGAALQQFGVDDTPDASGAPCSRARKRGRTPVASYVDV